MAIYFSEKSWDKLRNELKPKIKTKCTNGVRNFEIECEGETNAKLLREALIETGFASEYNANIDVGTTDKWLGYAGVAVAAAGLLTSFVTLLTARKQLKKYIFIQINGDSETAKKRKELLLETFNCLCGLRNMTLQEIVPILGLRQDPNSGLWIVTKGTTRFELDEYADNYFQATGEIVRFENEPQQVINTKPSIDDITKQLTETKSGGSKTPLIIAILALGVIGVVIYKKRKK